MSFRKRHHAKCSKCGGVHYSSESGSFVDPLFLPNMCPSCGSSMQDRWPDQTRPHWRHVVIKQQWIDPVRTRNPLTWFRTGHWAEVDRSEFAA